MGKNIQTLADRADNRAKRRQTIRVRKMRKGMGK